MQDKNVQEYAMCYVLMLSILVEVKFSKISANSTWPFRSSYVIMLLYF